MMQNIKSLVIIVIFAPLIAAIISALAAKRIGPKGAHNVTIAAVFLAFLASCKLTHLVYFLNTPAYDHNLYTWLNSGSISFHFGFLVDRLSVIMSFIITFISLLVHIYSMGYMHGDAGYQRFFSYVSLFTFAMLTLVFANNFMQLFFGWEGVGVVSYLLIGFWFHRPAAAAGSLKAFLVNRVGDFGFILAIAAILSYTGSLNYNDVYKFVAVFVNSKIFLWNNCSVLAINFICFCLFIGAMGKSAQLPLHVWLPESMEGPTPISALIHAATMVTAGIYMVTRMSPLFELSPLVMNFILIIGSTGALFLGLVGLVQTDIKRVVAYSTLSQLGYMIAATGASAYAAAMYHLITHAFFKALLFLGAGAVIVALHHEQDMRNMGGLRRHMPITFWTFLIGCIALTAIPPFSGFYSKDAIIEAVSLSTLPAANWAYFCLLSGAFVTALYTFRAFFMTFFGSCNYKGNTIADPGWSICLPLLLLAFFAIISGYALAPEILKPTGGLLSSAIYLSDSALQHATDVAAIYFNHKELILASLYHLPLQLSLLGIACAYYCYVINKNIPVMLAKRFNFIYRALVAKLGFDLFNDWFFVRGVKVISDFSYHIGDRLLIDKALVTGSSNFIIRVAKFVRMSQTGYLYHYVLVMVLSLAIFMLWTLYV